jgi:hypothetical protein
MAFMDRVISFSLEYNTVIVLVLLALRLNRVISDALLTVLLILLSIFSILDLILSGSWSWGGARSNMLLFNLVVNTLILMYFQR